jgi:pyrrolidone-carboxylate peptidase
MVGLAGLAACSAATDDESLDDSEDAVVVDTSSPRARAQYDADVAFLQSYKARCKPKAGNRPRVLVTGFGRFLDNPDNATGRIVSRLVKSATYPLTAPPAPGKVDPPGPQTSVAVETIRLPNAGDVDVCAMIVPVYWDLAAILVAREIQAFGPSVVVMNGIADVRQDLWLELGTVNRAMSLVDGSDQLVPVAPKGQTAAKIVPSASKADDKRGLLLSYGAVKASVAKTIAAHSASLEGGRTFGDVLTGVSLAGYPRTGNTYLCNNITYAVDYLMAYPKRTITLLKASHPITGRTNSVPVSIERDVRSVPRVFVHWPSALTGKHWDDGAAVLGAILDAQLTTTDAPVRGTNDVADLQSSGDTF